MASRAAAVRDAPVESVAETGSTNDDALALGRSGRTGPLWIRAARQSAGRGRQGRAWASPVGNLYCSLLLRVAAEPSCLPQLAHVAAVALVGAVRAVVGSDVGLRIKWPNDLLVDDAKLAGILVEGTRTAAGDQLCVVGWGLNCASFPEGLPYRATSLAEVTGRVVAPEDLFTALQAGMGEALEAWDGGGGYAAIRTRWLADALPVGTRLVARNPRESLDGRFQGIDDKGRLLLMGPHGLLTIEAGEINLN